MNDLIYKIIKIIDDKTVVINAGIDNQIQVGDEFQIFETGNEIIDPDTNENLGTLDTIKDTVEVINIFPKMSICQHKIVVEGNFLTDMMPGHYVREKRKTLNVEIAQISGGLSDDLTIRVGDKVRLIKGAK